MQIIVWTNGRYYRRPTPMVVMEQQLWQAYDPHIGAYRRGATGLRKVTVICGRVVVATGNGVDVRPGKRRQDVQHVVLQHPGEELAPWMPIVTRAPDLSDWQLPPELAAATPSTLD